MAVCAGDNALDYVIEGANVSAVDFNPGQIALCELKVHPAGPTGVRGVQRRISDSQCFFQNDNNRSQQRSLPAWVSFASVVLVFDLFLSLDLFCI